MKSIEHDLIRVTNEDGLLAWARFNDKGVKTYDIDDDGFEHWYHENGKKSHVKCPSGWEHWCNLEGKITHGRYYSTGPLKTVGEIQYFNPPTDKLLGYWYDHKYCDNVLQFKESEV